jgi:hypothetical protein
MTDFDYKKYSLERLEEWIYNAISSAEASPQEIYDVIKRVVEEQYYYHKHHTGRCYDLLALLNGNGKGHLSCDRNDSSPECQGAWDDFWENDAKEDKVVKWILPVEECKDTDTDEIEYFVSFPDDLLEATDLNEGDQIEWIDQGDGSYLIKKVN